MFENIKLMLKGFVMGVAEAIPGVSGGTIAFITGIYEELIETIKSFDLRLIVLIRNGYWKQLWEKINGTFLIKLLAGMFIGLLTGVFFITYLLEHHKEILWGFFFGLIIASSIYVGKQIKGFNIPLAIVLIVGALIAYWITTITPANGSESLLVVLLSAMIAVVALILPGISGSFILLLLGMYTVIIPQVKELVSNPNQKSLVICLVFALGALIGLSLFSRILSYAFNTFKQTTLSLLTGFMVGSLNKIWPWRNPTLVFDELREEYRALEYQPGVSEISFEHLKVIHEKNVLPSSYYNEPEVLWVILSTVFGFVVIFVIEYLFTKISRVKQKG